MWGQDLVVFKISHWSAWIAAAPEWIQPQVKVQKKVLEYRVALVICICCAHKDEFQISNQVRNGTQIRATHAGLSRLSTSAGNCLISAAWFKSLENCDSYVFDCFGGKNSIENCGLQTCSSSKEILPTAQFHTWKPLGGCSTPTLKISAWMAAQFHILFWPSMRSRRLHQFAASICKKNWPKLIATHTIPSTTETDSKEFGTCNKNN